MIIALVVDFTVLPALLALRPPPAEQAPVGLPFARADRWVARNAAPIVGVAGALALAGAALLPFLPLDFNPLNLQNPKAEAVATFRDLSRDPNGGAYAVNVLAPTPAAASALAARLDRLKEVRRTMTLESFVPGGQKEKLAIVADLSSLLGPTLNPAVVLPPPSAAALTESLRASADGLEGAKDATPERLALARHLRAVADAGPQAALALQRALLSGLPEQLDGLRRMLAVHPVTPQTLPPELVREWIGRDGEARVQALPASNGGDERALLRFAHAVSGVTPDASGLPITIAQSGKVVVRAFAQAGLAALLAIGALLWLIMRRLRDAALVLLPLVMGALYTVIGCVLSGLAINFANIIALPLLLGIGVAFNIYFVVNWRNGLSGHLQSATSRAILFSALATGSAFGSLALSPHLGTASMGLLLFLSLGLSVLTTFLVLPAVFTVLGRYRR